MITVLLLNLLLTIYILLYVLLGAIPPPILILSPQALFSLTVALIIVTFIGASVYDQSTSMNSCIVC